MTTPNVTSSQLLDATDDVRNIADTHIFPVLLESVLFAFYTVLMVFYYNKYRKGARSAPGVFAVSVCLYLTCTIAWALDISIMRTDLYHLIPSRLSPAGLEEASSTLDNARLNGTKMFVRTLCEGVVFVFCDVVSMWRAYVIYGRPRWLRTICIAIFVVSSGLYILIGIFYGPTLVASPPDFVTRLNREHGTFVFGLELAAFLTTAGAQVSSTALIARKAWTHRQAVQSLLSLDEGRSDHQRTTAVLYVVIESGLAYTLIWVLYVASAKSWFGPIGYYWGSFWMCQLSGIFPTLVVVIVSLRASILERSIATTPGPTITPIRFAVSGTDSETEVPQNVLSSEKLAA